jgi:hypothetical protein
MALNAVFKNGKLYGYRWEKLQVYPICVYGKENAMKKAKMCGQVINGTVYNNLHSKPILKRLLG